MRRLDGFLNEAAKNLELLRKSKFKNKKPKAVDGTILMQI